MPNQTPARSWIVVATLILGVCAVVGVLTPWAHGLELNAHGVARTSMYGFAHVQGIIALAGALGLVSVSVLRLSRRIGDAPYLVIGTTMCLLSLAASIWFWRAEVGALDPGTEALFRQTRISDGEGWRLTCTSLLASQLCLTAFAVDAWLRAKRLRIVHDDRALAGGSLAPRWLRFRVASCMPR